MPIPSGTWKDVPDDKIPDYEGLVVLDGSDSRYYYFHWPTRSVYRLIMDEDDAHGLWSLLVRP